MINYEWEWYEVWADDTGANVYLLLVYKIIDGSFIILDPLENYRLLLHRRDYDEVRFWLAEDEYTLIDGRIYD